MNFVNMSANFVSVLAIFALSAAGQNAEAGVPGQAPNDLIDVESNLDPRELFTQWTKRYGKSYRGDPEFLSRFKVFQDNIKTIKELNKQHQGKTKFGLTKYADLTTEEFRSQILMKEVAIEETESTVQGARSMDATSNEVKRQVASTVDWTKSNVVTPVKAQGKAGVCYIFASLAVLESRWAQKGKGLVDLSEEQVVDCLAANRSPTVNNLACGVNGGLDEAVYRYVQSIGGIASEEAYPYCVGSGQCMPCAPEGYDVGKCGTYPIQDCKVEDSCAAKYDTSKFVEGLKIKSISFESKYEREIAAALARKGPLAISYDAIDLRLYQGGILMPDKCGTTVNHASVIVGYGTEGGTKFWKVKNSWGTDFGEDGYFRIVRDQSACGINRRVTSVELE